MDSLPHNLEVERAALAAILLDPHKAAEAVELGPTSFYAESHRLLFRGIVGCLQRYRDDAGKPTVDLKLLAHVLEEGGHLERVGGVAALLGLVDGHSRSVNLPAYVLTLRELEAKREAVRGAAQIADAARNDDSDTVRTVLQQIAERIKAKHPMQEPRTIDLRHVVNAEEDDPIPWLIEGWLGEGDLCMFAGEWGTGKSLIALDLSIAVAAGASWMGRIPVTRSGGILYVDEENNSRNSIRRLRRMLRGRNMDPAMAAELPIRYLHSNGINLDTKPGQAMLRREIERTKPIVIVLDSMVRFHRRNENATDQMSAFFEDCLKPYCRDGITIVCLDHMRKPAKDDKESDPAHRIRGSGDKAGVADALWTLEGNRDEPTRTLQARKVRWEDSLPPAMTTRWMTSEDESAAWISVSDAALTAEAVVLSILGTAGDKGIYATGLFEAAEVKGVPRRTLVRVVKRLRQAGSINHRRESGNRVRYWDKNTALDPNS